jgi:hypothetical protein
VRDQTSDAGITGTEQTLCLTTGHSGKVEQWRRASGTRSS